MNFTRTQITPSSITAANLRRANSSSPGRAKVTDTGFVRSSFTQKEGALEEVVSDVCRPVMWKDVGVFLLQKEMVDVQSKHKATHRRTDG